MSLRIASNFLARMAIRCFGRTNVAKFARLLTNQVRLDLPNAIDRNGEQLVQRVFLKSSKSDAQQVVFDVGANVGEWLFSLCRISDTINPGKSLHLFAFEPCCGTMNLLRERQVKICTNHEIEMVPLALSDFAGLADFAVSTDGAGSNGLAPGLTAASSQLVQVAVRTLDDFCEEHKIGRIGLLKIDAEGFDLSILRGGRKLLEANRITILQFEYNQRWIDTRSFLKDAFELLQPLGYQIGKVTPYGIEFYERWHFEFEMWREANFVACLPEIARAFPTIRPWLTESPLEKDPT